MQATEESKYGFIESFCGPGGMSLGLISAGFKPLYAFDINEKAVETHNHNLSGHAEVVDAACLDGNELCHKLDLNVGELALFAGGPPCQGFSKQKRGAHLGDMRNNLVLEYLRLIAEIMPRFFFFENVAIFGQKRGKRYVDEMMKRLVDYKIYSKFVNSADYGLPQTRERFLVIGKRRDQEAAFQMPQRTVDKWKTVGEVLEGLPEPPFDYTDHPDFPNHQRARVTEINIRRFSHVPQGGGWQDIPKDLQLACHRNTDTKSGGWPDVYGRLKWDGLCPTITGGFDSFTRGRYGHPLENRPITLREAARIQGFPDTYVFKGTRADIRSQIGNAVPPPLAAAVGREILRSLLSADSLIPNSVCDQAQAYQAELF